MGLKLLTSEEREFVIGAEDIDMEKAKKSTLGEHEYVVGFYGDFNTHLEGLGLYVANDTHEFK